MEKTDRWTKKMEEKLPEKIHSGVIPGGFWNSRFSRFSRRGNEIPGEFQEVQVFQESCEPWESVTSNCLKCYNLLSLAWQGGRGRGAKFSPFSAWRDIWTAPYQIHTYFGKISHFADTPSQRCLSTTWSYVWKIYTFSSEVSNKRLVLKIIASIFLSRNGRSEGLVREQKE